MEGLFSVEGAVIVAFYNKELQKSLYVISGCVVLEALGERNIILNVGG